MNYERSKQKEQQTNQSAKASGSYAISMAGARKILLTRLGISIPAFSKIETGVTDVNLSRLEQIANIYEVSVVQLLTVDNEQAEAGTFAPESYSKET